MAVMPDELIPKALMDQVLGEITAPEFEGITDTGFCCVIQLADKTFRERTHGFVSITEAHRVIARDVLMLLNKDVREDGAWVFVWYSPVPVSRQPSDAILAWKDRDGDLIASIDVRNPIGRIYQGERIEWGGMAKQVLDRVRAFWRDLEITETQTRKAAQGQPTAAKIPAKAVPPDAPVA